MFKAGHKPGPRIKKPSRKQAINAMCKDCIYDPTNGGTWLEQVTACTSTECPLYQLRPCKRESNKRSESTERPDGGVE